MKRSPRFRAEPSGTFAAGKAMEVAHFDGELVARVADLHDALAGAEAAGEHGRVQCAGGPGSGGFETLGVVSASAHASLLEWTRFVLRLICSPEECTKLARSRRPSLPAVYSPAGFVVWKQTEVGAPELALSWEMLRKRACRVAETLSSKEVQLALEREACALEQTDHERSQATHWTEIDGKPRELLEGFLKLNAHERRTVNAIAAKAGVPANADTKLALRRLAELGVLRKVGERGGYALRTPPDDMPEKLAKSAQEILKQQQEGVP